MEEDRVQRVTISCKTIEGRDRHGYQRTQLSLSTYQHSHAFYCSPRSRKPKVLYKII